MKKLMAIAFFSFCAFSSFGRSWSPGENMKDALVNTVAKAYLLEQNSSTLGFGNGGNFYGAFLTVGGSSNITIYLQANTEYAFVGGGGNSASDVDIMVTAPSGYTYKDVQSDNTPVVRFTANTTGRYTVNLKLYSGRGSSFCCMAMLKSGGYTISSSRLGAAIDNIINYCDDVDENTEYSLKFLDITNQWCLYGGLMGQGEDMSINTITMGYGNRTIIAACDRVASDIDLYVNRNGYFVKSDTDPDASPITSFYASGEGYEIKVKNAVSSGRSFMMYCILSKY